MNKKCISFILTITIICSFFSNVNKVEAEGKNKNLKLTYMLMEDKYTATENIVTTSSSIEVASPGVVTGSEITYSYDEKFVKKGSTVKLTTVLKSDSEYETDGKYDYKWYSIDNEGNETRLKNNSKIKITAVKNGGSSCKILKLSKIGKYYYYCDVSFKSQVIKKYKFIVTVYDNSLVIPWKHSINAERIFGEKRKIKKIIVLSKDKKYISTAGKTGRIGITHYFKDKITVTYRVYKIKWNKVSKNTEDIKITIKTKMPCVNFKVNYFKSKNMMQIKIDKFAEKNLSKIYIRRKFKEGSWEGYRYKLDVVYGSKKGKKIIFENVSKPIAVELVMLPDNKKEMIKINKKPDSKDIVRVKTL